MDQRERIGDHLNAFLAALDGHQSTMWTALPGIIQSFDPAKMTAVVQPAIKGVQIKKDGKNEQITMPLLPDVPVVFPGGGGVTLTFPVKKGDECLVVFASRSIDGWWQQSGVQPQVEARMHDLSDAFAFVGVRSKPKALASISTTAAVLRSDDNATIVEMNPTAQTLVMTAPGGITLNGNTTINGAMTFDGDQHITGTITCDEDVVASDISLVHHTHSGVMTGGGDTGEPS